MEEKNYTNVIPGQKEGEIIHAESLVETENVHMAKKRFESAKLKLLDVNNWQKQAGKALAAFQLTDAAGNDVTGPVQEGYYFKIDIPGPGSNAGEGFDWVKVEKMEEYQSGDVESIAIRVRPASNPATDNNETAHFYSSDSTSTFTVTREGNKVTAAVYDRNTKANAESDGIIDKIRDVLVGMVGIATFSEMQWKSLTNGLIAED
ncbi:hypothetical protein [Dyadobacter sediminis]|uniref:Uncharacterized protein n=1 Tax=Dyadobacter sediminis TaxID=1493691 RepID=A0A5R9KK75_9BACT|nr:hypothetical protein [Dyadobacter sediminis]TLU96613.1 hypothetical protein FEM55_05675 [Dyadobacter sediminis]GGB83735.1 hypothetical protein GCM10011325_09120 [Dyadobacter sediminis]